MNNLYLVFEFYTNGYNIDILSVISLFSVLCAIFVIVSKNPVEKSRKLLLLWEKLPNSGEALKLLRPSQWVYTLFSAAYHMSRMIEKGLKYNGGWINHSGTVTSQKIFQRIIGNRGSKSAIFIRQQVSIVVKEQRVYGSWSGIIVPGLRCTLMGFERNSLTQILPNHQISRSIQRSLMSTKFIAQAIDSSPSHKLNPWFVTGFTDAEGSFSIWIRSSDNYTSKWKVQYAFSIGLHKKDLALLESIQRTLGVGKIYKQGSDGAQFRVESLKELKVIITHFDSYPLITKKQKDFELFKMGILIVSNKEHLTLEGLNRLVSIKASMNKGISKELKPLLLDIKPMVLSITERNTVTNPYWFAGFTSGEGCFSIRIHKSQTLKSGKQVQLRFLLTQHTRDYQLMINLMEYLGCGKVYINKNAVDFIVVKFSDLTDKIIPLLMKYPIQGDKFLNFLDFVKATELMKNKLHLTKDGLYQLIELKSSMNTGREGWVKNPLDE